MATNEGRLPGLHEVLLVWGLFALVAVEVLVTYARLGPHELYNVSGTGLAGGAGRALVFLGYPTAFAVTGALPLVGDRIRRRFAFAAALLAVALCATGAWPGVIDQADLDAKPANGLAAAGVLLALGLTGFALLRGGLGRRRPLSRLDLGRIALAALLLVASIPWLTAELGFSASAVPGLGSVFMTDEPRPEAGQPGLIAVHLGHHHGMDGTLFALTALLLSRAVPSVRARPLRLACGFYVAFMLVYGLANALQDFWLEQLVKRGTVDARIPELIRPDLSPAWAALLVAAVVIHLLAGRVGTLRPLRKGGTP